MDLLNPKLSKIWEVVTFKEFLSEHYLIDDIYFYLHCRYVLFKGPTMIRHDTTFDIF
jgi:hypothetical protein